MDEQNNLVIILLFFILIGVAWLIWPPLIVLILMGFLLKYWYESRVNIISIGGYRDPKQYEHPEDLLKCKICKVYFHKDHFQEHILQSAIKEQESINGMPFLSFMMAKNRHQNYLAEAIEQIRKAGGKIEIDSDDGEKIAVIKGDKLEIKKKRK
ncbi:hypothetical protein KKH59_00585 [Patescibacteria group bacterium]|nr:hypothetical protein [Patescibacteria group bacterium]